MTKDRIIYFLGGLGIGLAAALLCAPKSGANTRKALAEHASTGQDYVKRQTAQARDAVVNTVRRGQEAARATGQGVADAFARGKAAFQG